MLPHSQPYPAVKIEDISALGLSSLLEKQISNVAYQERMLWELYLESCQDYNELRKSLLNRGFKNVSACPAIMFMNKPHQEQIELEKKTEKGMLQKHSKSFLRNNDAKKNVLRLPR